jgi:hypothetical protein
MKRDDFLKLLDSVEPIPRMVTIKSLGGVVVCVRPLKVSEEKEIAKNLVLLSDVSREYQSALQSGDMQLAESAIEKAKELNYAIKMQKIAYCLVDEDGSHIVETISELDHFGVDVIEEISDKIDESATYKSLQEAIKKK